MSWRKEGGRWRVCGSARRGKEEGKRGEGVVVWTQWGAMRRLEHNQPESSRRKCPARRRDTPGHRKRKAEEEVQVRGV